jgi:hypothetical protein
MHEYRVISKMTELPRGSRVLAIPEVEIETGELGLFGVGSSPFDCEITIIGRWYPGIAGYDWIWQPDRWIRVARDVIFWIIGRIVPLDDNSLGWAFPSGLLVASAAIVEICNLLTPLAA